jgi:hypothetical protein
LEAAFVVAKAQMFTGIAANGMLLQWSALLTDEFTWSDFLFDGYEANIDARVTEAVGNYAESGDNALQQLIAARASLLLLAPGLLKYEPPEGRDKAGEAYALAGYVELLLGEDYCAGIPLDGVLPGGGVQYTQPLTTDSIFAIAEAHFDTAVVNAGGDNVVGALASVGLSRALLDRGKPAAAAVSAVPTNFVYNMELEPSSNDGAPYQTNLYAGEFAGNSPGCAAFTTSDREGQNGLNFVSARDPRLVLDSTIAPTCDGIFGGPGTGTWYYPVRFGLSVQTYVPLATGIEARLIEAEDALHGGDPSQWASDLDVLRTDSANTHVMFDTSSAPIKDDSTIGAPVAAQVDFMFRERAFWLFGSGTRLGDLRRLVRQYGRGPETVFPTGAYANGVSPYLPSPLPQYGGDVALTLPAIGGLFTTTNPNYRGCLMSAKTA